jgi:hypothetical protein
VELRCRLEVAVGFVEPAEDGGEHRQLMVNRTGRVAATRCHEPPEGM